MTLTTQQKKAFTERGFVRLQNAVAEDDLIKASDAIWRKLAEFGIQKDHPLTWYQEKPKGAQSLLRSPEFDALFTGVAPDCLDILLGKGAWQAPKYWGQILIALPTDKRWHIPHNTWHLDLPVEQVVVESPGAQVFICIEDVKPKCGATVVAAGSHQLVTKEFLNHGVPDKSASAVVRKRLAAQFEWFQRLSSGRTDSARDEYLLSDLNAANGVKLQVQELTANRGDVILMHPFLLHAASPNIGPNIRLVLTQRIYTQ